MDTAKRDIRRIIDVAFDGVPRPATSLRQFWLTDQKGMSATITEEEWRAAGITNTDAAWQDIPDHEIEHCDCQLAHMQGEAFRYYLPAYMAYAVAHAQDSIMQSAIPGSVIFGLTPSKRDPSHSASKYDLLDPAQKEAVAAFLAYMAAHAEDGHREDAKRALAFWPLHATRRPQGE